MMQFAWIGLGAGAAAALLFASVTSGTLLSIPLFYLSSLPIMIAGLGWSHWAALIAAFAAALGLGIAFGPIFFVSFMAVAGLPAWLLGYLAMLARPAGEDATALEWYPPGRLVMWAALLGALVLAVAIPHFGFDADSFRAGLRKIFAEILRVESGTFTDAAPSMPEASNANRFLDFLVIAVPPTAAVIATLTNVLDLWLAGVIVRFSGRLHRPWPILPDMSFPRPLLIAFAAAVILSFTGGLTGIVAGVVSASLLIAYSILGLAVLHAITRHMASRVVLLAGVYTAVLVLGWPVLGLCLLGLTEAVIDLRARIALTRGPPAVT